MTDTAEYINPEHINRRDVEPPPAVNAPLASVALTAAGAETPPSSLSSFDLDGFERMAAALPEGSSAARSAARLISGVRSATGVLSLAVLLGRQPAETELAFPRRADALAAEARRRMAKSAYQFPAPALVLRRVREATAAWEPGDANEAANRVMHALARLNLAVDGFVVSVVCRRLASEPLPAVEEALRAFLGEARRGSR